MAAKNESISSSIVFDTSSYKSGLSELNRQMRVLESGFRATAAGMDDWSKTATGLESRNKALSQQIDVQKQKVEGLSKVYEELAADERTSAKEKEEMQIKINKENEALGKLEKELRNNEKALNEMGDASEDSGKKVDDLAKKEADAAKKADDFRRGMKDLVSGLQETAKIVAGIAGAVALAGAALGKLVTDTAETADGLVEMSLKTGISVEKLQEMNYIGKQVGTSTDTIAGAMVKMTRNMGTAREQGEEYTKKLEAAKKAGDSIADITLGDTAMAFGDLGVSIYDFEGNLRDSEDVFNDAISALSRMEDGTNRDVLAMAIFGKSALELNPLIKTGQEQMKLLAKEAHEVGAVMSEEDVTAMGNFNDAMDSLKDGLKGTMGTLATAFLPAFEGVTGIVSGYLKQLASIVRGSGGDLGKIADGIGELVSRLVKDIASQAPKMMQAGLGILQGIVNSLVGNLQVMLPAVIEMITSIMNFIVQNLPMLITASVQIIVALANGIAQALPALIPAIVEIIPTIITILLENLPLLLSAAAMLLIGLANGIGQSIPILLQAIPPLMNSLVIAIGQSASVIGNAAVGIVLALVMGIGQAAPQVVTGAKKLIDSFVAGVEKVNAALISVGASIVAGVWKGIQDNAGKFKAQVTDFFSGMVDAVKTKLKINSPSLVFAEIGASMVEGLGYGFSKELGNFEAKMRQAASGGFGMIGPISGMVGATASSAAGSESFVNYGFVQVSGPAGQSMGEMIRAKRF